MATTAYRAMSRTGLYCTTLRRGECTSPRRMDLYQPRLTMCTNRAGRSVPRN